MDKIIIKEALVVEGKYDKNTLSQIVDAPIFVTDGFGIFKDPEKLALLRAVAEKRGLIVLTDSDGAGFVIRGHLKGAIDPALVKHAYIPDLYGKEKRKAAPGKEGKLGVEGMDPEVLLTALTNAGATFVGAVIGRPEPVVGAVIGRPEGSGIKDQGSGAVGASIARPEPVVGAVIGRPEPVVGASIARPDPAVGAVIGRPEPAAQRTSNACPYEPEREPITKTDLYELGLSGRPDSKERRRALQKALALPENLSTNALLTALNCLYTKQELEKLLTDMAGKLPALRE